MPDQFQQVLCALLSARASQTEQQMFGRLRIRPSATFGRIGCRVKRLLQTWPHTPGCRPPETEGNRETSLAVKLLQVF